MRGDLDRRPIRHRVKGRPVLTKSLRQLLLRVYRFGTARAATADDRRWARQVGDALTAALRIADPEGAPRSAPADKSLPASDQESVNAD